MLFATDTFVEAFDLDVNAFGLVDTSIELGNCTGFATDCLALEFFADVEDCGASFTVSTEVDASVNTLLYRPCISLTKNFSFSHCMLCTCSFDLLSFGFIYRVKVTLCVSLLSVNGAL